MGLYLAEKQRSMPYQLYAWRTQNKGSPGPNFIKFENLGGQTFFTLKEDFLQKNEKKMIIKLKYHLEKHYKKISLIALFILFMIFLSFLIKSFPPEIKKLNPSGRITPSQIDVLLKDEHKYDFYSNLELDIQSMIKYREPYEEDITSEQKKILRIFVSLDITIIIIPKREIFGFIGKNKIYSNFFIIGTFF